MVIPLSFAYEYSLKKEPPEIDDFNWIMMALRTTTVRPLTGDEYTDYNIEESYSPGKKGALWWWCQDT